MSTGFSDQHSTVEFTSQNCWRGRSSLSAEPSYNWGEMRESNSRSWDHNPVPSSDMHLFTHTEGDGTTRFTGLPRRHLHFEFSKDSAKKGVDVNTGTECTASLNISFE